MYKRLLVLLSLVLFTTVSVAQVDTTVGLTAPDDVADDIDKLAHYLCDPLKGERLKANAVYNWLTHNIKYDPNGMYAFGSQNGKMRERAAKVLKDREGVCEGYSKLFTELCRAAGLHAVCICGYSKDWTFDNGDKLYIPRHMWAAVRIDGQWELVDVTWGAGYVGQSQGWLKRKLGKGSGMPSASSKKQKFKFKYDTTYFLQDPMSFRLKHLPLDPYWQLTDTIMPREYFETGDSAVKSFNALCKKTTRTKKLDSISELEERAAYIECAERAYQYNDRYPDILAVKQVHAAAEELQKVAQDSSRLGMVLLVQTALDNLRESLELVEKQKRHIPEQYAALKRKNMNKTMDARKDINDIKTDNRKAITNCRKYVNIANSRTSQAKKKRDDLKKYGRDLRAAKITSVQPAKTQKKADAPEVRAIKDSLRARNERITELKTSLEYLEKRRDQWLDGSKDRLGSLAIYLAMADTMVLRQMFERMAMKDNYDDDLIKQKNAFKKMKEENLDKCIKNHFADFDSINQLYDNSFKLSLQLADHYKKNLRALEQYKKWCANDETIAGQYAACREEYAAVLNAYLERIYEAREYVKRHKSLFDLMAKLSKDQIKATTYMEKAEKTRKTLEEKDLEQKQVLDRKESEERKKVIEKVIRDLEQARRMAGF